MAAPPRRARDLDLLDALDICPREKFSGTTWRVVREGRDPLLGAASRSRWCDGAFDVLYTSLERDGALAEVHAYLSLQPVFPSKMSWRDYRIEAATETTLVFADLTALGRVGVEATTYRERDYSRTQAIADAAFFLGFDGLIAPSARWTCQNLVLFTDRLSPDRIAVTEQASDPIDWKAWRKSIRR
jgi:hypothetical protein